MNQQTSFSSEKTTTWSIFGGDTSIVNLLNEDGTEVQTWKTTISRNPVPISFKLKPIYNLVDNSAFQDLMRRTSILYLALDTPTDVQQLIYN